MKKLPNVKDTGKIVAAVTFDLAAAKISPAQALERLKPLEQALKKEDRRIRREEIALRVALRKKAGLL